MPMATSPHPSLPSLWFPTSVFRMAVEDVRRKGVVSEFENLRRATPRWTLKETARVGRLRRGVPDELPQMRLANEAVRDEEGSESLSCLIQMHECPVPARAHRTRAVKLRHYRNGWIRFLPTIVVHWW